MHPRLTTKKKKKMIGNVWKLEDNLEKIIHNKQV